MKSRRFLAIMLAVLLLIGMLPTSAFAHALCDKCKFGKWKPAKEGTDDLCGYYEEIRVCKVCGNQEFRDKYNEHKWGKWKTLEEATDCRHDDGVQVRKCSRCGYEEDRDVKGNHKWGAWKTVKDASCNEEGKRERKCSVCGKKDTETIAAGAHAWGEWVIIREADPMGQTGIRERTCSKCGKVEREEFYPDGTLQRGDRGDEVKALQEKLNDAGNDCGKPDGIYGGNTEKAIKDWQKDHDFAPDGISWPGQRELMGGGDNDAEDDGVYTTAIELELLTDCSVLSGALGEEIVVEVKATNIGETIVTMNSSVEKDGAGNYLAMSDYIHFNADEANDSWFRPGESVTGQLTVYVQQSDIEAGEIYREHTQYARPLYYSYGDEITDVPAHIEEGPEGAIDFRMKEEERVEDSVIIRIPLKQAGLEAGIAINSTPANGSEYMLNEEAQFEITVKNSSDVEIKDVEIYWVDDMGPFFVDMVDLKPGEEKTLPWTHIVDDVNVLNGMYAAFVMAAGKAADGTEYSAETDAVTIWCGDSVNEAYGVKFSKVELTMPINGQYYTEGETVVYGFVLSNTNPHSIYDVEIVDPLKGNNEDSIVIIEPELTREITLTYEFVYKITAEDVQRGYVDNQALAAWTDSETNEHHELYSNVVTVLTGDPNGTSVEIGDETVIVGGLSATKSIISTPANGAYYVPGETVIFEISFQNTTDSARFEAILLEDHMSFSGGGINVAELEPGQSNSGTFDYIVTELDAEAGRVINAATVTAWDSEGQRYVAATNSVSAIVGTEETVGANKFAGAMSDIGLVVTKSETSVPANGLYYTEGETISYRIDYANTGSQDLGETIIGDILKQGDNEIAAAEMLHSGESRFATFSYTVTADDVANGYVANIAYANASLNDGGAFFAVSNVVVSDTDGDPNTTYAPGSGKIDYAALRGTPESKIDTCYIETLSRDGDSIEYKTHLCTAHAKIWKNAQAMIDAADDPLKQQMAADYAAALWLNELNRMYEEILAVCDTNAMIAVLNERVGYNLRVTNKQMAMRVADPSQTLQISQTVAGMWQAKCMDLCTLINTAPNARPDSIFSVERIGNEKPVAEKCSCLYGDSGNDEPEFADSFCAMHAVTYEMMEILLLADDGIDTWTTVKDLWTIELNNAYNKLYQDHIDEGGMAYLSEYTAFQNWLNAYEMFVMSSYPENPETVAEVMMKTIMDCTLDACGR